VAALFGTTLAPITGHFGWRWGIVASFVHSSVARTVGQLHGGLVLYNSGFAAGLVAAILVSVILLLRAPDKDGARARRGSSPGLAQPGATPHSPLGRT